MLLFTVTHWNETPASSDESVHHLDELKNNTNSNGLVQWIDTLLLWLKGTHCRFESATPMIRK